MSDNRPPADQPHGPLTAADQSAVDGGCTCSRRIPYFDWTHDPTCRLHVKLPASSDQPEVRDAPVTVGAMNCHSSPQYALAMANLVPELKNALARKEQELQGALEKLRDTEEELLRRAAGFGQAMQRAMEELATARKDALTEAANALLAECGDYCHNSCQHLRAATIVRRLSDNGDGRGR